MQHIIAQTQQLYQTYPPNDLSRNSIVVFRVCHLQKRDFKRLLKHPSLVSPSTTILKEQNKLLLGSSHTQRLDNIIIYRAFFSLYQAETDYLKQCFPDLTAHQYILEILLSLRDYDSWK